MNKKRKEIMAGNIIVITLHGSGTPVSVLTGCRSLFPEFDGSFNIVSLCRDDSEFDA